MRYMGKRMSEEAIREVRLIIEDLGDCLQAERGLSEACNGCKYYRMCEMVFGLYKKIG